MHGISPRLRGAFYRKVEPGATGLGGGNSEACLPPPAKGLEPKGEGGGSVSRVSRVSRHKLRSNGASQASTRR